MGSEQHGGGVERCEVRPAVKITEKDGKGQPAIGLAWRQRQDPRRTRSPTLVEQTMLCGALVLSPVQGA